MRACGSIGKTDAYTHMMLRLCLCVCYGCEVSYGRGGNRSSCGLNRSGQAGMYRFAVWRFAMYFHDSHIFEHRPFTAIAEKVDMLVDDRFQHACQEHDHINL